MRSTQLANQLLCAAVFCRPRRSGRMLGMALGAALVPGCVTAPEPVPQPPPVMARVEPSRPVAPPVAVSAPPVAVAPALPDIEIHQANLHGQFENKQGQKITIKALLMMTKNRPEVGHKGVLFYGPPGAHADSDWIELGEVEVCKPLDPEGKLQVKCLGDEKKFAIPGGKTSTPLVRKTRLKLRWEY